MPSSSTHLSTATHLLLLLLLRFSPTTSASPVAPGTGAGALGRRADSNPGVDIVNAGSSSQTFYFCENVSNGDGTADPGFTSEASSSGDSSLPAGCASLVTSVSVAPLQTAAVALDPSFKGRVARTTDTPATWVELQIQNTDDAATCGNMCGYGWGDVSLQMGCDGAATVAPADGTGETVGFTEDVVSGAPSDATTTRGDGATVIKAPWYDGAALSQSAIGYLIESVPGGAQSVYINNTFGTSVAASANNRFLVTFY